MAQGGSGDVIIRIRSDSRDFQADIERARNQLNRLAGSANQAGAGLRDGAGAMGKLKAAMMDTAMYGGSAAVLMGLAAIPGKVREAADSYTDIQSKLKLATTSTEELAVANERLFEMSQKNRVAFGDTVQLYSGIAMPLKDAGKSQEEILKFTDLVGKGLQVSGSSAGEAASTIKQLSQAMASGVLRGDEFNSIMENGKAVSMALAEGLGTTTGKLREMAEKGMLKSELVFNALMSQSDAMNKKFAQIAPTMEKVWVTIGNSALLEIGKLDQATGASAAIAKNLMSVANNMDAVFTGAAMSAGVLAAIMGGKGITAATGYAAAKVAAMQATRANAAVAAQSAATALAAAEAESIHSAALLRQAEATVAATSGMARLSVVQNTLIPAQARATAAAAAHAAALAASTAAASTQAVVMRGLTATMGLLGGPAGVAMLAAGALYYFAESNNDAATAITLANGQTLTFSETLEHVTEISNEYRDASTARQGAIREEIDNIIKLTNQRKVEAQQQLEYLNQLDAASAKAGAGSPEAFANSIKKGWADLFGLDQGEAKAAIKEASTTVDALTKKQGELGKSAEELAAEMQKTPQAYEDAARAALAAGDATKKATAATVEAGQVLHGHGDTIKSLVESLTQQRIELQHGKEAADYYAKRLQGLTDAEARAAIGASQYNTYLAERKKINLEAAESAGGLRDKYIANLDAMGLTTGKAATQGIDAAKQATESVVKASDLYRISIDEATEALKRQADAAKAALAAASNPVVPDAAGVIAAGAVTPSTGGKADPSLSAKMKLAAKLNPSTMAAISSVSQSSGLDPVMMKAVAWIESTFNAKAHNKSSASGVYQFVDKTAAQYGLSGKQFDPVANTQAYVRLLNDNMKSLKRYGLEVNSANLYLAHQQGADGLKQIVNESKGYGRVDKKVRANMDGNKSGYAKDDSAAEFLRGWREKFATVEASVRSLGNETSKVAPMFKEGVRGLADEATKIAPALAKTGTADLLSGLFPVIGTVAAAAQSTFKGVAKEAGRVTEEVGKNGVAAGVDKVVTAVGKIAPAAAGAIPIWDELNAKTQKINDIAVEYNGTIDQARMTEEQRNQLADDYMTGQAKDLVKAAEDHLRQIQMTTAEYRAWELHQKQFNAGEQQRILYAEQQAEFTAEQIALNKELIGIRNPGQAAQYAAGLSDKNLSKDKIKQLTKQKMEIVFEGNMKELEGRAEQAKALISGNAEAYQHLTMARDGFNDAQIRGYAALEREVQKLEETAEVNKRFAESLESDLTNSLKEGELSFQGFADTVISEITRLKVIKPLMESLFGGKNGGGLFGGGEGGMLGNIVGMMTVPKGNGAEDWQPMNYDDPIVKGVSGIWDMLSGSKDNPILGFAKGGAFTTGGVQAFANGGAFHNTVLHKPTQFFANGGLAVAGEAGAEAVMPLTRIGGKLGVMAVGGGGAAVTVQPQVNISVINNVGAKVETKQQTDASGAINITMMIDQIEGAISDRARRGQGLANVFKRAG